MTLSSGRMLTLILFITLSYSLWHLLDGFTYRLIITAIPLLFAAQLTLSDLLEATLTSRLSYKTRWFTLLIAPGTILHELCHLLTALALGCTVTKAALFRPNPKTGVLGYVAYIQPVDKWVVFREFTIGFAPFFGCGIILLLFNTILGGGLLNLIDSRPITDAQAAATFIQAAADAVLKTASTLDYNKPTVLILIYLQLCFTIGAAPSSTDFKGAFSSLYKHPISATLFLACAALAILLSQRHYQIGGYETAIAAAIGATLKFTVTILLLSTILLIPLIPVAYTGSRINEIDGIAKTIPLTSALVAYYLLQDRYTAGDAIMASAVILISTATVLILTNPKKTGKIRLPEE